MRIVQLIDSLEAGGAERMAVNYANILSEQIEFSGLISTRKEGALKESVAKEVTYLYLKKTKTIDFKAILRLRKYLVKNKVQIIQAHSSSFFLAVLVKLTLPRIKIIWHDHYGNRIHETKTANSILLVCSFLFSACFVVNAELEKWVLKNLGIRKVFFIPNFIVNYDVVVKETYLKGEKDKRIVCIANLKKPKNHITILKAFNEAKLFNFGWSLHFVGKVFNDDYFHELKNFIVYYNLDKNVFFYDSKKDVLFILSQANIGVLASKYEGFPVCILEYGFSSVATISTNVGFCNSLIKDGCNGLLFDPVDTEKLKQHFLKLVFDNELQKNLGKALNNDISNRYSCNEIIKQVILKYNYIINE